MNNAAPTLLPPDLLPTLPPDWQILQLPPGTTRGLKIQRPTLIIGTGPRCTSVIAESDDQPSAVYAYNDVACWNVTLAYARDCGLALPNPGGHRVYVGDSLIQMNKNQGLLGNGHWYVERCLIQGNGLDPHHEHGTFLRGQVAIERCLLFQNGAQSLALGNGQPPYPKGHVSRSVIAGMNGYYGALTIYPTTHFCHNTIIGKLMLFGGAQPPQTRDGNWYAPKYDQTAFDQFAQPIFRFYFPKRRDALPYGAYPFDERLNYPNWTEQFWAHSMSDLWWAPEIGKPFYPYYPLDDVNRWETFMRATPEPLERLRLQLELHGGWTNLLAHLKT
jgi:hypothetical protein